MTDQALGRWLCVPGASVLIINPEDGYNWLAVSGKAELGHDGADDHIDKMAKKYLGKDKYPFRQPGEVRVLYRIKPEHTHGN